jgi:hypothetical protein
MTFPALIAGLGSDPSEQLGSDMCRISRRDGLPPFPAGHPCAQARLRFPVPEHESAVPSHVEP